MKKAIYFFTFLLIGYVNAQDFKSLNNKHRFIHFDFSGLNVKKLNVYTKIKEFNTTNFEKEKASIDKLFFAKNAENMIMIKGVIASEYRSFSYGALLEYYQLNVLGEGLAPISIITAEARTFETNANRYYSFSVSSHLGITIIGAPGIGINYVSDFNFEDQLNLLLGFRVSFIMVDLFYEYKIPVSGTSNLNLSRNVLGIKFGWPIINNFMNY